MQIDHIALSQLSVSKANMRAGKKPPDVSDILPSIFTRGVLSPLFVRPSPVSGSGEGSEADHFEIVAGKRRYFASLEAVRQGKDQAALPCIVIGEADDAEALEVSMIENMLRQDPDPVTQWESFTRLVKEGRSIDDIAATFVLTELAVKRILALGNLLPRIREAHRAEEIDAGTIRHLTLASKAQQKAWLALFDAPNGYAPRGSQLKEWLFGGGAIATSAALFDLADYHGQIITDLFAEQGWFADSDMFWAAQNAAIAAKQADYLADGWSGAEVVPPGTYFQTWEHEKTAKRKGGRVYIDVNAKGEVTCHEGYLTRKEAKRLQNGGEGNQTGQVQQLAPTRTEVTSAMTTYVDLHRHAAVRLALAARPSVALRVMVAHAICGSPLWTVRVADQRSRNEAITESIETCAAETAFDERRRAVLAVLGFDEDRASVVAERCGSNMTALLTRLLELPDPVVMEVLALVMAETLAIGSTEIELLGPVLSVDMASHWQADPAFFELLRDREVATAILAEVGDSAVASANAGEKLKVIKGLISDHLIGSNERTKRERWVPRWMAFPPSAYTARGGVQTVASAERAKWFAEVEVPVERDANLAVVSESEVEVEAEASLDEAEVSTASEADGEGKAEAEHANELLAA